MTTTDTYSAYSRKHMQGYKFMSHRIEQSRTDRFAQTVSRKRYRTDCSIKIIVIRILKKQHIVSDIGRVRFGIGEFSVVVLTDPRLIHSITPIGKRKPPRGFQIGVQNNKRANLMP